MKHVYLLGGRRLIRRKIIAWPTKNWTGNREHVRGAFPINSPRLLVTLGGRPTNQLTVRRASETGLTNRGNFLLVFTEDLRDGSLAAPHRYGGN